MARPSGEIDDPGLYIRSAVTDREQRCQLTGTQRGRDALACVAGRCRDIDRMIGA